MKVEFINPFLTAGSEVLIQLIGGEAALGQLALRTVMFTTQEISILVGVSGQIEGQVIYGMSQVSASKIASAMMGNEQMAFDEMAASAVSELGNIISGNAMNLLCEANYICEMTPPTIVRGVNVEVATRVPALMVPLQTRCGKIDINVALNEHA
jgi:chemotaxis protein CheX